MELDVSGFSFEALMSDPMMWVILGFVVLVFLFIIGIFILRYYLIHVAGVANAFQKKVVVVTMPKDTQGDDKGTNAPPGIQLIQEKIAITETFFSTIAGLKAERGFKAWLFGRSDTFSLELVSHKGKISFYIAMPAYLREYIEEQLHAQFPTATVDEVDDYNIFTPKGVVGGKILIFGKKYIFPIKTFKKFDSDPLNSITNALSKVDENDSAAVQVVIRSARGEWHNLGSKVASIMQQGKKAEDALKEAQGGIFYSMFLKKRKSTDPQKAVEPYRLSPMEEEMVKALEEKSSKAGCSGNIRIISSSENPIKMKTYLDNLCNSFSQFNIYKYGNGFKVETRPIKRLVHDFIFRKYDEGRKMIFNTEELASIYHFPIPKITEAPNIRWQESKRAPAPTNIRKTGVLLGINEYRGKKTEIRMVEEDRRRHMYIVGMTGTGKSYYASGLAMQDIMTGHGICYIDPHGDDLENILAHVPKERAEDVVFFDPSDVKRPMGINLLEFKTEEQKTFAINEIMAIFDKLYDLKATGGPMFEQYFKNAAALIMADTESGSTLLEISRVLSDDNFRNYKLARCKNIVVKDFWEKEALKAGGDASLANMVPYITSKMSPFISNDFVRPIISQQNSTIDLADIMNNNKIFLVKLAKGKIGDINANLLGMVIIGKILMAALARGDMPMEQRKDFFLYIDEFQNFLTDSIEVILSEARKYKLCLIMAHQFLGQLVKNGNTRFKDAIFGNVGTKIGFRIGVDDAEMLAKEFAPVFSEYDFLNSPSRTCFVKLLVDNANPPPFHMKTLPHDQLAVAHENKQLAQAIKELSRLKYGKDPALIDLEIKERQSKKF